MLAPSAIGNYITDWQMVQEGVTWFGNSLIKPVSVVQELPSRGATIMSDTIPTRMLAGISYPVSITVRNDGSDTWTSGAFPLGAVGDSDPFTASRQYISSGQTVAPGQAYTFSFSMTAPPNVGTYVSDWQMVQEYVAWFGGIISKNVEVI